MTNTTFSAAGYGTYKVTTVQLAYGVTILSSEDQGRFSKTYYPRAVQQDNFVAVPIFTTIAGRHKFYSWIQNYGKQFSSPNTSLGMMRVTGPRNFDFYGIPVSGMEAITTTTDTTWTMHIQFAGAQPASLASSSVQSSLYYSPSNPDPQSVYFYPEGVQLNNSIASDPTTTSGLPPGFNASLQQTLSGETSTAPIPTPTSLGQIKI